ncbi:unnamed protein product [Echinostoma caproni]|uniref:Uncharacterized protein n=1 Tax=Echinostoma caproni TaxID=27848 RepID=A0A183AZN1_9TREM|nr:unnamed protein product [Echinostoma caproni]
MKSSVPGVLIRGHRPASANRWTTISNLSDRSEPMRDNADLRWSFKSRRRQRAHCARPGSRSLGQETNKLFVAKGDQKEFDWDVPKNSYLVPQVQPRPRKQIQLCLVNENKKTDDLLECQNVSQSNQHAGADSDYLSNLNEIKTTYLPLRPSKLLSSQLLMAAKAGDVSQELIFSDLTASLCERRWHEKLIYSTVVGPVPSSMFLNVSQFLNLKLALGAASNVAPRNVNYYTLSH